MTVERWKDDRIVLDVSVEEARALRQMIIDGTNPGHVSFWGGGGGLSLNAELSEALGSDDPTETGDRAYPRKALDDD